MQQKKKLLKVQPTDNPGPVGSSQLRGRSDACFLIDMHASIKAGTEWIMYTNDGCYGTDHIPITPQFLLVAFRFTPRGSEEIWSAHSAVASAANTHTPTAFLPHSSSIGSAQQDSRADVRLRAHLHAPPATIIPAEDDDELLDATPDIDVPVSTAVSSALTHLEQAIDDMHSASPKPLSFDPLFISPFPVCPSHTHGLSSPLTSKTSSLSWIDTSLRTWWRLRPRSTRDSNTLPLCSAASSKILPTLLYIQS